MNRQGKRPFEGTEFPVDFSVACSFFLAVDDKLVDPRRGDATGPLVFSKEGQDVLGKSPLGVG